MKKTPTILATVQLDTVKGGYAAVATSVSLTTAWAPPPPPPPSTSISTRISISA